MAEGGEEFDKSETATPFKLDRARRKGMVARGSDLGYLSALLGLAIVVQLFGAQLLFTIQLVLKQSFKSIPMAKDARWVIHLFGQEASALVSLLVLPVTVVVSIAIVVEIVQVRGVVFSSAPLKPDFARLNPAKGLKRLFSLRMLKELGKNLLKFVLYAGGTFLLLRNALANSAMKASDGRRLGDEIVSVAGRLLLMFIVIAAAVAVLDQILARREFGRQMRMSKREVTREAREREGEPRQKRQRKQILADILKQAAGAANVKGADVLIVNPTHYAVALRYRGEEGDAPVVQARGRNIYAQRMRRAAEREGIVIVRNPRLARALFHEGQVGRQIGSAHFVAVADIYIMLRRAMAHWHKTENS